MFTSTLKNWVFFHSNGIIIKWYLPFIRYHLFNVHSEIKKSNFLCTTAIFHLTIIAHGLHFIYLLLLRSHLHEHNGLLSLIIAKQSIISSTRLINCILRSGNKGLGALILCVTPLPSPLLLSLSLSPPPPPPLISFKMSMSPQKSCQQHCQIAKR